MADPIQDFIVRLRFSVDSGQQRHFDDMIKRSHDSLGKLNLDLIGAITAIGVAIEKSSKQLRDFGITAQVTGTASGQIDDLAAAFRTMGRTTADAQNQIQSLFATITQNPGVRNFIQAQGFRGDPTNIVAVREFILDYLVRRFPGGPGSRGQIRRDQFAKAYFGMEYADTERGIVQLPMEREQRALQERRRRELGLDRPQVDPTTGRPMTDPTTGRPMNRYEYLTNVQSNRIQKDLANLGTEFELFAVILQDKWGDRFAHFLELITGGLHEFNVLMASSSPWASGLAAVGLALTGVIGSLALLRIALFGLRFSIAPLLALLRLVPGAAAGGAAAGAAAATGAAATGTAGRIAPTLAGAAGLRAGSRAALSTAARGGALRFLGMGTGVGAFLSALGVFDNETQQGIGGTTHETPNALRYSQAANDNVGSLMGLTQALERSGVNQRNKTSGAIGRNQMMPATAKALAAQSGMPYDESMLYNPAYNDKLAGLLLQQLMAKYHGNLQKVLIDYNAGPVREKMWERMGDAGLKQETVNYYHRGMGLVGRDPNLARGLQKQGVDITQNNYYTIHGGGDAERAAAGVGQQQNRTNANLTRQVQQVAH